MALTLDAEYRLYRVSFMLSVFIRSATIKPIMLSVVMLIVVAPQNLPHSNNSSGHESFVPVSVNCLQAGGSAVFLTQQCLSA
jgi:hypothetical protein